MTHLSAYLDAIGRVRLLTSAEEVDLARAMERGREAAARVDVGEAQPGDRHLERVGLLARERFMSANLRLVVSIAKRYPPMPGLELDDLIQEGNVGLARAVDRFEWRVGCRFSTIATYSISQAIGRAVDTKAAIVRAPMDRIGELRRELREGADPSRLTDELRRADGCLRYASLDRPVVEGAVTLGDVQVDTAPSVEDVVLLGEVRRTVRALLERLEPDTAEAVALRFGLDGSEVRSYTSIAAALGTHPRRARLMIDRALAEMRPDAVALAHR